MNRFFTLVGVLLIGSVAAQADFLGNAKFDRGNNTRSMFSQKFGVLSEGAVEHRSAIRRTKTLIHADVVTTEYSLNFSTQGANSFGGQLDATGGSAQDVSTPEPATSLFIGSGLVGLYLLRRRRQKA